MKCVSLFTVMALFAVVSTDVAAQEERNEDHVALRSLRETAAKALNTNDFDLVLPHLHERFSIITVDGKKFTSIEAFKSYWEGLFTGENPPLKRIEIDPQADTLTDFLDEYTGVVHGTSNDTYHFNSGDVRSMTTRWTAVVQKEKGGWKSCEDTGIPVEREGEPRGWGLTLGDVNGDGKLDLAAGFGRNGQGSLEVGVQR